MGRNDYTLIAFDDKGNELRDGNGQLGSEKALQRLQDEVSTDVFLMSHGWMGDIDEATREYNAWTDAMLACHDDLEQLGKLRTGFKPLLLGYHWPSLPYGNEKPPESFLVDPLTAGIDPRAECIEHFGGRPEIAAAVNRIFDAVAAAPNQNSLTADLEQAYLELDALVNPPSQGPAGAPDTDRAAFDPRKVVANAQSGDTPVSFGGFSLGALMQPLRTISFWMMKKRARSLGETAGADLLRKLQRAGAARNVQFHMMGHSFGCIVVSSMIAGSQQGPAPDPVQSAVLVQGAMSLWSYATKIPKLSDKPGYFVGIVKDRRVQGPIITTMSRFDRAVGILYPLAVGLAGQADFDQPEFPLYGGTGAFGLQGTDVATGIPALIDASKPYNFEGGKIYNINGENIIKTGGGTSGAHSDIAHPEVGHLIWQAAMTATATAKAAG